MSINHLLIDVPDRIETDRLTLRVPRAGDGAMVFESVRESWAELKSWMPWAKDGYGPQDAEEWCRKAAAEFLAREQMLFLILSKAGRHLGNTGLCRFNWDVPRCEIGYWLCTGETGKGFVTEAVHALAKLALEIGVARVEIHTDEMNKKSWRIAERCGFTLDGVLPNYSRNQKGELRNIRIYSKVSSGG